MIDVNWKKMLFVLPAREHTPRQIKAILDSHPEVKFVSFAGSDIVGNDTDEKIPVQLFQKNMEDILKNGIQTDGSSVYLPAIAELNDAKVDIIADMDVNWYVDYNFAHIDGDTKLPIGTLRIPSFLYHNKNTRVGSRAVLADAEASFKRRIKKVIAEHPELLESVYSADEKIKASDIEDVEITVATELEFWVKTPEDTADRDQLSTAQILKEQYWKRTTGPVRAALEACMILLDHYGIEMEMGHKEVGGVKAKLGNTGSYDHVMEQLEIDWKYSSPMQASDNEAMIKYIVKDVFLEHGLEVTFMAKPIPTVSGSGEHTHFGMALKLKDGSKVNLFSHKKPDKHFMSAPGYGALMGILKNYDVINPFVSTTNDAFNRLEVGFEAPVCTATSLGNSPDNLSRNRSVLICLIRSFENPLATRFELRSPNPNSNTYMVVAATLMAMMDGIEAVADSGKVVSELEASISKKKGEDDFYLMKEYEYRCEDNVFDNYSQNERDELFGMAPKSVWENINNLASSDNLKILKVDDVMTDQTLESHRQAVLSTWATELTNRLVPDIMDFLAKCSKQHGEGSTDYDLANWNAVVKLKNEIGKTTLTYRCMLGRITDAVRAGDYQLASDIHIEMKQKLRKLEQIYNKYMRNLF